MISNLTDFKYNIINEKSCQDISKIYHAKGRKFMCKVSDFVIYIQKLTRNFYK